MSRGRGSWPALLALAAAFLLLFAWQRGRSEFLQIEAQRDVARAIAAENALALGDVFALRDLVGVDAPEQRWRDAARRFAALRARDGDQDAAVAGLIDELPEASADGAIAARRFAMLRARFSQRAAARH